MGPRFEFVRRLVSEPVWLPDSAPAPLPHRIPTLMSIDHIAVCSDAKDASPLTTAESRLRPSGHNLCAIDTCDGIDHGA